MTNSRGIASRIYSDIVREGGLGIREIRGAQNPKAIISWFRRLGIVRVEGNRTYVATHPELTYTEAMRLVGFRMEGRA